MRAFVRAVTIYKDTLTDRGGGQRAECGGRQNW